MGLGSFLSGIVNGVKDVVHTIAPGFEFTPSGILKEAAKLLPIVGDAIPIVGPFIKNAAIEATSAIFSHSTPDASSSGSAGAGAQTIVLPQLADVEKAIAASTTAITGAIEHAQTTLEALIKAGGIAAERQAVLRDRQKQYEEFAGNVRSAIHFLKEHASAIAKIHPYSPLQNFEQFVRPRRDDQTELKTKYDSLKNTVEKIQFVLEKREGPSQDLLDLYILGVVWLLTYDKTFLHLRVFLAQSFIATNIITDYTTSIANWNVDFDEMKRHAQDAITFLLGEFDAKTGLRGGGFLDLLRKDRLAAITDVTETKDKDVLTRVSFEDKYDDRAVGYVGKGTGEAQKLLTLATTGEKPSDAESALVKLSHTAYVSANMAYFDLATRAARQAAEFWDESLYDWQTRLPMSPPSGADLKLVAASVVKGKPKPEAPNGQVGDMEEAMLQNAFKKGKGWQAGVNLMYAVAYVTSEGEGFMSPWSPAVNIEANNVAVRLEVGPVKWPENAFTDKAEFEPVGEDETDRVKLDKANRADVLRRVYVQRSFQDQRRTYLVATINDATRSRVVFDTAKDENPRATS